MKKILFFSLITLAPMASAVCLLQLPYKVGTIAEVSEGHNESFKKSKSYQVKFSLREGDKIYSPAKGIVESVQKSAIGQNVTIKHRDKTKTTLGPFPSFGLLIEKGGKVEAGQLIGFFGCSKDCKKESFSLEAKDSKGKSIIKPFMTSRGTRAKLVTKERHIAERTKDCRL